MPLGLDLISVKRSRDTITPILLDEKSFPKINWLISRIFMYTNNKYESIDFLELENTFLDWKVGRGLIKVLLRSYFKLEERRFEDILNHEELLNLKRQKIKRPIDLRIEFFKFIQNEYGGVIPTGKYEEALKKAAEHFGLSNPKILSELLYLDNLQNRVIRLNKEFSAEDIASFYNFEVLMTLLYYATSVSMRIDSRNYGFIAKKVYPICKRYGVLVDFVITRENNLKINMVGPKQLFGRPIKYGLAMASALSQVFRIMDQVNLKSWWLSANLKIRNKDYKLKIDSHKLKYIRPLPAYEKTEWETFFDSDVEKRLFWIFESTKPRGWTIEREPEPIQVENILVIPDFILSRGDTRVFVEIVGFWRKEYVERKIQKYTTLCRYGIPIFLLIDSKIFESFKEVPCAKLKYVSKGSGKIEFSWKRFFEILSSFEKNK